MGFSTGMEAPTCCDPAQPRAAVVPQRRRAFSTAVEEAAALRAAGAQDGTAWCGDPAAAGGKAGGKNGQVRTTTPAATALLCKGNAWMESPIPEVAAGPDRGQQQLEQDLARRAEPPEPEALKPKVPRPLVPTVDTVSVDAWRQEINAVYLKLDCKAYYTELAVQTDVLGRQPCQLVEHGSRPVLVTAPHSIYVLRDGHTPHRMEVCTAQIARAIADELQGTSLEWTDEEQQRSKSLWDLSGICGAEEGALLDPRNRDPNFLATAELAGNQWHRLMCKAVRGWGEQFGRRKEMLHIDVHGCRDPPETPSHLTIGLGAMMQQAECEGPQAVARVEAFGVALKAELTVVVNKLGKLRPAAEPVRVLLPFGQNSLPYARFSGYWPDDIGRHTQSQQAISFAGFSHSVQLEMTKSLRKALMKTKPVGLNFGNALRAAWAKAKSASTYGACMEPNTVAFTGLIEL